MYVSHLLKCILLGERSQSEKAMIPTTGHFGEGKTMERIKRSVIAQGWRQGEG